MVNITNKELIKKAKSAIRSRRIKHERTIGDVGCALVSGKGNVYLGVCIDITCGIGFCAEHAAIAAMVTHGEFRIQKIVAATKDGVVPPCGRCREFMNQIHEKNLDAKIIISENKTVKLKDLLPYCWDQ